MEYLVAQCHFCTCVVDYSLKLSAHANLGMGTDFTGEVIVQWRDRLVSALRSMNMGDIADQTIRQLERAVRVAERNRTAKDTRGSAKVGKTVLTDHSRMDL